MKLLQKPISKDFFSDIDSFIVAKWVWYRALDIQGQIHEWAHAFQVVLDIQVGIGIRNEI